MKVKHPIALLALIIIYITICTIILVFPPDGLVDDILFKLNITSLVLYICVGLGTWCIEWSPKYYLAARRVFIVCCILAIIQSVHIAFYAHYMLPQPPPAELDEFGNPIIPDLTPDYLKGS